MPFHSCPLALCHYVTPASSPNLLEGARHMLFSVNEGQVRCGERSAQSDDTCAVDGHPRVAPLDS